MWHACITMKWYSHVADIGGRGDGLGFWQLYHRVLACFRGRAEQHFSRTGHYLVLLKTSAGLVCGLLTSTPPPGKWSDQYYLLMDLGVICYWNGWQFCQILEMQNQPRQLVCMFSGAPFGRLIQPPDFLGSLELWDLKDWKKTHAEGNQTHWRQSNTSFWWWWGK